MRSEKRAAVVTGAGGGIERAIALRFAQEGANITIADVDEKRAGETAKQVRALGREALVILTDISRSESEQVQAVYAPRSGSSSGFISW